MIPFDATGRSDEAIEQRRAPSSRPLLDNATSTQLGGLGTLSPPIQQRFEVLATPPASTASHRARFCTVLALLIPLTLFDAPDSASEGESVLLALGENSKRRLSPGEAHSYLFEPGARTPFRLLVEQQGIDVGIEVETQDGNRFVVDGPFDRRARETALLMGSTSYHVILRGRETGAPSGLYSLSLEAIAAGTPEGDRRLRAAGAATTAARLYNEGTADSYRNAIAHYGEAQTEWQSLGEDAEAALCLYARAALYRITGAPDEGLAMAQEALSLFRRIENSLLAAYALNELGLNHWRLGHLEAAREAFERSMTLQPAHKDPFVVASAASNLCLMDLSGGELRQGRTCYEGLLPTIERAQAPQIESAARTNLGRIAEHLGEPAEALGHYNRALELLTATGQRRGQAQILNNLGVLLRGLGDLDNAMASYAQALEIFEEIGDQRWQARVLNNIGFVYRSLDEPMRSLSSFEHALKLFRQVADRRGEAASLDNLGLAKLTLGATAAALELHRLALEQRRQVGHRQGEAQTLRRLGEALAKLGRVDEALLHLEDAAALSTELGDLRNEAEARRGLGEIRLQLSEIENARGELEKALKLAVKAGQRTNEAKILIHLATAERAAGNSDQAQRHLAEAQTILSLLRARLESPDLRTSYSSLLRRADELEVNLLMEAHLANPAGASVIKALEAAERARGSALVDLIQEAAIDLTAGVDEALLERRQSFAQRLNAKTQRLADPKLEPQSRKLLATEQLSLRQRLEALDTEIRSQSPAYAELVRPQRLSAQQVQSLLDRDTTLAVYFLGKHRSYLFRVTQEAIDAYELPERSSIESAAYRLHSQWSEVDVAARAENQRSAHELGEMLKLRELTASPRLAIVADGALNLVPFGALPVSASPPDSLAARLIEQTEVVSLPSSSVLALTRSLLGEPSDLHSLAILADPVFGPGFSALPGSRLEAEAIAGVVRTEDLLTAMGADANQQLVESGRLEPFDVVHFATHGIIDLQEPSLSGLVLSQINHQGQPSNGVLRLADIYNLRFEAELVVLSGCRTAVGPVMRGEGLIGLARGFQYAGARRVMASLWRVEDRATAALMAAFYHGLWNDSLSPSAALRQAQLELSHTRRFRDPTYWAGFILIGDWR